MTNKATMGRSLSSSMLWALRNTRRRAGVGGGASFLGSIEQQQQQQQLSSLTSAQRDVTVNKKDLLLLSAHRQSFSSTASSLSTSSPSSSFVVDDDDDDLDDGPWGDLFGAEVGYGLVGKRAWIHRSFGARANSDAMLTCGGSDLAKHASFDPSYDRARSWIRHHAVGPAVLSPILINGLVGALVEASVPHSVPMSSSIQHKRPLIVGVSSMPTRTHILILCLTSILCCSFSC